MELKVSVIQKGKIFKGKGPEIVNQNLTAAMYEATSFLEGEVKMRTPYRTGALQKTIHGEVKGKGTPITKGIVAHQSVYGDAVEKGTGIYGFKGREFIIRPKNAKALFWKGAKHPVKMVIQKGFPGRHMFENAFNENWVKIQKIFDRCGFEIARELNE